MTRCIDKPVQGEDFYIEWSTIIDCPVAWGTRAELEEAVAGRFTAADFDHADLHGTSNPLDGHSYGDGEYTVHNAGSDDEGLIVDPKDMRSFCLSFNPDDPTDYGSVYVPPAPDSGAVFIQGDFRTASAPALTSRANTQDPDARITGDIQVTGGTIPVTGTLITPDPLDLARLSEYAQRITPPNDHTIYVELTYPRRLDNPNRIVIELLDVRATDDLIITYDYERNGWRIGMDQVGEDLNIITEDQQVAFLPAWNIAPQTPTDTDNPK